MRTPAAVVAAWAEWVVWTCNTGNPLVTVKRERTSVRSFFWGILDAKLSSESA
jgi:hypothetical protein